MDDQTRWSKFNEGKDSYRVSKYLPTKYSLISKGKTVQEVSRKDPRQEVSAQHQ